MKRWVEGTPLVMSWWLSLILLIYRIRQKMVIRKKGNEFDSAFDLHSELTIFMTNEAEKEYIAELTRERNRIHELTL